MSKIVIFGAGQIGINAVAQILSGTVTVSRSNLTEVVLYSPRNHKRVEASILDMEDAATVLGFYPPSWTFKATNELADMQDAEAVFMCAGAFPTYDEYKDAEKAGIDGRLLQAKKNMPIVKEMVEAVKRHCSSAIIFVVSNPVDVLCDVIRKLLPNNYVYGMGCSLDSARFKNAFWQEYAKRGHVTDWAPSEMVANVIGRHNGTMFLHMQSFKFPGMDKFDQEEIGQIIAEALCKAKDRGGLISRTGVKAGTQKANNGAYFAPAVMVAQVIAAFCSQSGIVVQMNREVLLYEKPNRVNQKVYAQLNCEVSNGRVTPVTMEMDGEDLINLWQNIDAHEKLMANL